MSDLTGQTLGRYRILKRIGRGGMAEVYQAYQPSLDRYVAIKVLHSFLLEEQGSRERFQREARAVAALRHPNIVQVIDFDEQNGIYFMVMELIDGPNLKAVLQERDRQGTRLPLDRIETIIAGVGSALAYAHEQGMIHRDVKPHNIMFSARDQPLLTDFGVAKILGGASLSGSGAISGTPAYMSPEQGQGGPVDARTDIYSLGVVLYEMVTGRVPFDADTPFAVAIKHINDPLPLPSTIDATIPVALERVVLKAMAKVPDERYQTADSLVQAVRQAVAQARQPPAPTAAVEPAAVDVPAISPEPGQPSRVEAEPGSAPRAAVSARFATRKLTCSVAASVMALLVLLIGYAGTAGLNRGAETAAEPPAGEAAGGPAPPAAVASPAPGDVTLATAQPDLSAGAQLLATQAYSEALDSYEAALRADPVDPDALFGRGQALLGLKRYREAVDAFTSALAVRTDDPTVLLARAEAYAALDDWSEVLADTSRVLERDRTSLPARLLHARASVAQGDQATAEQDYSVALEAHPGDTRIYQSRAEMYRLQGKVPEALADIQKALALNDRDADLWVALGNIYVTYSDTYDYQSEKALEAYTRALLLDPRNSAAYYGRGRVYVDFNGDRQRGRADLTRAIEIGPATAQMYYLRGRTTDDPEARLADLSQAIAVEPANPDPLTWRAEYFLDLRQYGRAAEDFGRAIEIDPDSLVRYAERSHAYLLQGDFDAAAADAQLIIERAPESSAGYLALGQVLFVQGDYDGALEQLDKALERSDESDRVAVLLLRGRTYVRLDRLDEAKDDFDEVLDLDSGNGDVRIGQAELALAHKSYDQAMELLDQWAGSGPNAGVGYLLRAEAQLALGRPGEAREDLDTAREHMLYPDEVEKAEQLERQLK